MRPNKPVNVTLQKVVTAAVSLCIMCEMVFILKYAGEFTCVGTSTEWIPC